MSRWICPQTTGKRVDFHVMTRSSQAKMPGRGRTVAEMCGGISDCEIGLLLVRRLRRQDPNMRPAGQQQACSTGAAGGAHRALRLVSWATTDVELHVLSQRHLLFTSAQLCDSRS